MRNLGMDTALMVQIAGVDIKKDIALGTNKCVHGKGLSLEIIKHVKPIFS